MQIKLTVGDWSDNGHGKTNVYTYEVSCTQEQLISGYFAGVKALGLESKSWNIFELPLCTSYRKRNVSSLIVQKLKEHGALVDEIFYAPQGPDYYDIDPDLFSILWLEIAKIGLPDLKYEEVTVPNYNIGGYGLFL